MGEQRLVNDWLASYLEYTSDQESPETLHLWTALACLAAASRRKVFLELEYGKIFPNLYVIIVAESARVRKSTAMDLGRDLLMDAIPDIVIMRDSMTSQGLIKALNHTVQVIKNDKIQEERRSDVAIFADEIANLFGYERTRASQMVIFLTRAYGCPAIYDHTTVRDSTVRLHNLYPVLLGGTDPHNLKVLPEDAIGGLTGRLIWIIERDRRANNSGWKRDSRKLIERKLLREYLIHDLQCISNMQGEMRPDEAAMSLYDLWYKKLSERETKDPQTDAFYQRCHTTALHVAMLLAMSRGDDLTLTESHMAGGIALIEQQLPEVKRVAMWSGSSIFEQHRSKFITFMIKNNGLATRRTVLKYMGMGAEEFDKLLATLIQDGSVESPIKVKNELVLKLTKTEPSEVRV